MMPASGALTLLLGTKEASDAWADALMERWEPVRSGQGHVERLVIHLDDGPKNSQRRTQFLKRMAQFADWSGLEVRLVCDPTCHSKYAPIERCWSALERKWRGALLSSLAVILWCARQMTWKGRRARVRGLLGKYRDGVRVPAKEMRLIEARLRRSSNLPKYDITIEPKKARLRV